jgi:gamma-glutamyltranspeptidase/glutathione hydrolase
MTIQKQDNMNPFIKNHSIIILTLLLFFLWNETGFSQKWPVYSQNGMVVSTNRIASEVGVQILKKGGNAVDAAVATGFALAVVNPGAGNIGGGGFMVIYTADGNCQTIDYREKAPKAVNPKMYLDEKGNLIEDSNHKGYLAVGVPGTVAGFILALEKFGTMPLKEIIQPAIALAEKGFPLSQSHVQGYKRLEKEFKKYPGSAKKFFKPDGSYYQLGVLWIQKDLAATLKRISRDGINGFYGGKTAEIFEREMKANGGLITKEDLSEYRAIIRESIKNSYRGYQIYSMAPPSSGGITLSIMLNILEGFDLNELGHNSAQYVHLLTEAMRRAYSNRAQYLGDPVFNSDMPVTQLISKDHAATLRQTIDLEKASKSNPDDFAWGIESEETTHFCVVDKEGNAVSNTFTLEYFYGSRIVLNGAGFLLNNEMGDFNPWPGHTDTTELIGTEPNLIQPGKRMLSSMTPTIVVKDGKPFMLIGSPGGRTIINTVLQCILNVIDFDMNIFEAIDAPRFHHQWLPDVIRLEKWGITGDTIDRLKDMGHRIKWYRTQGRAMGIIINHDIGLRMGASDPRSPNGGAVGY